MFHPKWQKIPRHGGSFAAFFPAQDAMFSTEDSRAAADVTTWARPKPGRVDISSGGLDEPVEFIGMSLKEFECVIFVGTCVGEVWWNATDYLGPKRFGNRSRTAERKEHLQEEVQALQCVAYNGKFMNLHSFCPTFWDNLHFNNPTTESP